MLTKTAQPTVTDTVFALHEPMLLESNECSCEPQDLTVPRAHAIMRLHAHYSESPCRQRRTALSYLVAAGRYTLAQRSDERRWR